MANFFISYNRADRQWAEWIGWQLEEVGYKCYLQDWDFRPGTNFVLKMHCAAKECARTIAVLSSEYLRVEYAQAEWAAAFTNDPSGASGALLPVKVGACDPGGGCLRQ
ncbi:toll/interleukin-1 receptor domain-containing protein [Nitrospirillum iridis]|uniref:TIR domain-containing protein n=1 Tax=Nitrospirillum iridis TaxID=765888 RepID=A0A7X0EGY2_9PROT|nr:toll/interleukin-1 receptor domain-containing protein [Nitrospirillum iridis]MBB6255405.1 hypothetical protein [Nitrospirillum iridis]